MAWKVAKETKKTSGPCEQYCAGKPWLRLKMELPETPIPRVTVATCWTAPLKAARKLLNIYSM